MAFIWRSVTQSALAFLPLDLPNEHLNCLSTLCSKASNIAYTSIRLRRWAPSSLMLFSFLELVGKRLIIIMNAPLSQHTNLSLRIAAISHSIDLLHHLLMWWTTNNSINKPFNEWNTLVSWARSYQCNVPTNSLWINDSTDNVRPEQFLDFRSYIATAFVEYMFKYDKKLLEFVYFNTMQRSVQTDKLNYYFIMAQFRLVLQVA